MSICITEDVQKTVDDAIPIPDDLNNPAANDIDYQDTLAEIEPRLIPEADCDTTRARFEVATQESHEDRQAWHSRICFLWLPVNLDTDTAATEVNRGLIHKFLIGLRRESVSTRNCTLKL